MKQEKINSKKMKEINTRNVLNKIRKKGCISRKNLVVETGLTTGTITNIINELIEKKYLIEVGSGESDGGRKPILIELNADVGYAIGLEMNVTEIICVISDFKTQILGSEHVAFNVTDGRNAIIDKIIDTVETVITRVAVDRSKIIGMGLAIPGPCNYEKGIMINPPNFPNWINVPIKDILEKRLGFKIYTSKETSCATLSEYWFGETSGNERIFGIVVGKVGIGGALILDGEIFQEKEGDSMDIGHTTVQTDGFLCSCRNRGCLEAHANSFAAVRYVQEMIQAGQDCILREKQKITYDDVIDGVNKKDTVCIEAIKKCAFYLGVAIRNVISLLSPQSVLFGGDFVYECPLLYEKTVEYLERREYPVSAKNVKKACFTFGEKSGAIGGLALVFDALSKS